MSQRVCSWTYLMTFELTLLEDSVEHEYSAGILLKKSLDYVLGLYYNFLLDCTKPTSLLHKSNEVHLYQFKIRYAYVSHPNYNTLTRLVK